jgi:3-oxoacyl-[acyl-carrier protein] reductase
MTMSLEGKRAVVTGGGQGIGRAIAAKLASMGAEVAIVDLNREAAEAVVLELEGSGGRARAYELNVADADAVKRVFATIAEDMGGIDVLVNNAGITRDGLLMRMSQADWESVMSVNLTGAFNCTRAVARCMMSQRSGRIINVSSVVGIIGNAGQANYAASKAGLIALTKSVARELGSRGVTANAIAPGYIETPMTESLPENAREEFASRIALRRFGTPNDVANVVAFLASDDGDYVTGQTINVDGGMVMQ